MFLAVWWPSPSEEFYDVATTGLTNWRCEIRSAFITLNQLQFYVAKSSQVISLELEEKEELCVFALCLSSSLPSPSRPLWGHGGSSAFWWAKSSFHRGAAPAQALAASCHRSHIPEILISWERWDRVCLPHSRPGETLSFRERASLACLCCGTITPGCSVKQTHSPDRGQGRCRAASRGQLVLSPRASVPSVCSSCLHARGVQEFRGLLNCFF